MVGVALSDPGGVLASPLTIIERRDDDSCVAEVIDIVIQNQVAQIVVGLPYSMNGSIGFQAEKVKDFTEKLRLATDVSMEFRDERLSTVSAKQLMRTANIKKKGRGARYDAMAAALVLQGYLDEGRGSI